MLDKWLSSYNNWGKLHTSLSCGSCCPRSRIRRAVKYSGRLSRQFRCRLYAAGRLAFRLSASSLTRSDSRIRTKPVAANTTGSLSRIGA